MEKLAVVFKDKGNQVFEKFTFQVRVHREHIDDHLPVTEIGYALRAFFLKLSVAAPLMRTLPPGSFPSYISWTLVKTLMPGIKL